MPALDRGYSGRGIYHANDADYAIHFSVRFRRSDRIMLSAVLPGNSHRVSKEGEKLGGECEAGFDSCVSPEQKEIVLFRSEQILPLFIINFMRLPNFQTTEERN